MAKINSIGRPIMPSSYGIKSPTEGTLLDWSFVSSRMETSRNYWLATASTSGTPHAAPIWGLWHQDAFYFSTDRRSRKGQNVAIQPRAVVHLESGDEVVIIEGLVSPVHKGNLLAELDELYFFKYTFHLDADQTFRLAPGIVLAWMERDFVGTATKWVLHS